MREGGRNEGGRKERRKGGNEIGMKEGRKEQSKQTRSI